jgi:oxaloacetate decarboxylase gamma subunit
MDMLGQSGTLSLLGMSVVFGFLLIMVIAVTLMGKIVHAVGADKDVTRPQKPAVGTAAKSTAVAAAITAAVTEYRKTEEEVKNA